MQKAPDASTNNFESPTENKNAKNSPNSFPKYKRRGYGAIVAILITIGYAFGFPIIFKSILQFLNHTFTKSQAYVLLNMTVHSVGYLILHSFFYWLASAKIGFFERYRVLASWPWETDAEKWKVLLKKSLKTTFIDHFIIFPILIFADVMIGIPMNFDLEAFPGYVEIFTQFVFFMVCEDFVFYWLHRTLHHPKLYPYIHKQHHEYSTTVSLAAEYAHPLEFIFVNLLAMVSGVKILDTKVHIATYMMWGIFRLGDSVQGHCGYDFSWSPYGLLPFTGSSSYHNFHHSKNVGNYGSLFTFWDTICGTNRSYYKHENSLKEQEKKSR
jgi:methylsterol monooxygenase/4-alpha-methyl-delta7-sterol-4alpha-methyl oxidase